MINEKNQTATSLPQHTLISVTAQTHAEFLNKVFGTNYVRWMKSVWKYHNYIDIWMVRFYDRRDDWENRFVNGEEIIHEVYLGTTPNKHPTPTSARVAVSIEEYGSYRRYSIKGLYRFVPSESNPRLHVYQRVPDAIASKMIPHIYQS